MTIRPYYSTTSFPHWNLHLKHHLANFSLVERSIGLWGIFNLDNLLQNTHNYASASLILSHFGKYSAFLGVPRENLYCEWKDRAHRTSAKRERGILVVESTTSEWWIWEWYGVVDACRDNCTKGTDEVEREGESGGSANDLFKVSRTCGRSPGLTTYLKDTVTPDAVRPNFHLRRRLFRTRGLERDKVQRYRRCEGGEDSLRFVPTG